MKDFEDLTTAELAVVEESFNVWQHSRQLFLSAQEMGMLEEWTLEEFYEHEYVEED